MLQALSDPDAGVRENAIILAERWLSEPRIGAALLALADKAASTAPRSASDGSRNGDAGSSAGSAGSGGGKADEHGDANPRLRFQLLATLGSLDTPASHAAQERLLLAGIEDEWMQAAALSASSDRAAAWFERALQADAGLAARESPGRARFFERLGGVIAAREKSAELTNAIAAITNPSSPAGDWWRAALLEGVARGIGGSRGDRRRLGDSQSVLLTLATGDQARLRRAAVTLLNVSGIEPGRIRPQRRPRGDRGCRARRFRSHRR